MDFSHVKSLAIPEGNVKQIKIGNVSMWSKPAVNTYGIWITNDNTNAITDFYLLRSASLTFQAEYNVPAAEENATTVWSISGLPSGLSLKASNGLVSGYAESAGTSTVTVSVTKGSYSASKTYTFIVASDGYGVDTPTVDLPTCYADEECTVIFTATTNIPAENITDCGFYYPRDDITFPSWLYVIDKSIDRTTQPVTITTTFRGTPPVSAAGSTCNLATRAYVNTRPPYLSVPDYKSPQLSTSIYVNAPRYPVFSQSVNNLVLSAEDCMSSSNEGSTLGMWDIDGTGLSGITSMTLDGAAFDGNTEISGSSTGLPKIRLVPSSYQYGTYLDFAVVLEKRYKGTASVLKGRTIDHTLTVTNDYGTAETTIHISYE